MKAIIKTIKYLSISIVSALLICCCDANPLEMANLNKESEWIKPVVSSMDKIVIDKGTYNSNSKITFSWKGADFGVKAEEEYGVYLSNGTRDINIADQISGNSYSIDASVLYMRLTDTAYLGLQKGKDETFTCYVTATIGSDYKVLKSAPVTMNCYLGDF